MNQRTDRKPLLLILVGLLALSAATSAADSEAETLYRDFVSKCETATSMEELLPFLPEWRRERYEASDEEARQGMFERICKATDGLEEMTLVGEEATDAGSVLQFTASWNGSPMKGKVTLITEGGSLKVEEWFWATGD